jgi:hypothetical protein
MAKPTAASIAAALTVPERLLLFCLACDTGWQAASITHATAQQSRLQNDFPHPLVSGIFVIALPAGGCD